MAQSIKLGNDTYLDASGVVIDNSGTLLSSITDKMATITASPSIALGSTDAIITWLNSNNTSIPSGKIVFLLLTGVNNSQEGFIIHKVNNSYGGARALGYYQDGRYFRLASGTWSAP